MTQANLHLFFYLYAFFAFCSLILLIFVYQSTPYLTHTESLIEE